MKLLFTSLLCIGFFTTHVQAKPQINCDDSFGRGLSHYYARSYDSALFYFRKIVGQCAASVQKEQAAYNIAHIFTLKNSYDSAIIYYHKLIKSAQYDSSFVARANLNIGIIYHDQLKYDSAAAYYNLILKSKFNDKNKSFAKKGLMDEPYMNYHYYACNYLADIYLEKKEYEKAIQLLQQADSEYSYKDYSATRQASKKEALKAKIAYCTGLKGDVDNAYTTLSSYMASGKYNAQEYFILILKSKHDNAEFTREVEKQVGQIKGKKELTLFGYKINFSSLIAESAEEKNIKDEFLKTDLYKNYLQKY